MTAGAQPQPGRLVTYSKVVDGRSGIFVRDLTGGPERELIGGWQRVAPVARSPQD